MSEIRHWRLDIGNIQYVRQFLWTLQVKWSSTSASSWHLGLGMKSLPERGNPPLPQVHQNPSLYYLSFCKTRVQNISEFLQQFTWLLNMVPLHHCSIYIFKLQITLYSSSSIFFFYSTIWNGNYWNWYAQDKCLQWAHGMQQLKLLQQIE